jgi:hypothetical protein
MMAVEKVERSSSRPQRASDGFSRELTVPENGSHAGDGGLIPGGVAARR